MNNLVNQEHVSRLKEKLKKNYRTLNWFQKASLFVGGGLSGLLLISLMFNTNNMTKAKAVKFESIPTVNKTTIQNSVKQIPNLDFIKLQNQLLDLKQSSDTEFNLLKNQLASMQTSMSSLASQSDLNQLQNSISQPNPALLSKVDDLQLSVEKVIQQTAKVKFVNPRTVAKQFKLVAVQGFSDGMRAIIDINGNPIALSLNQTCSACHGWILKKMNFSNQTAVFAKGKNLFVKLQVK